MKIQVILFFALCGFASVSHAQDDSWSQRLSPADVRQDIFFLKDTLERTHPGLYRFRSRVALDQLFDSVTAGVRDSLTVPQFYLLTSYLIASIENGHTNCRLPGAVVKGYYEHTDVFPAAIFFIHNRAYIYCCKHKPELVGTELLAVNGKPMKEIIHKLFQYISTDGAIESRKNWELPDNFFLLLNEVYGHKDSFAVVYRTRSGLRDSVVLKAERIKDMLCGSPFTRPKRYLSLEYKPGIAVLTIKTFFDGFLLQTGENFHGFLDSAFKNINARGVTRLLIDLRNNQGGNDDNGELLYAYLTRRPFRYYASQETMKETFGAESHPTLRVQQPAAGAYSGKVYFLINGRSFSATAEFAAVAKSFDRGIFIGEETGGGYYGDVSGSDETVILPRSGIECRVPEVLYTLAVRQIGNPARGTIPDYPADAAIDDLLDGSDSQLAYALALIGLLK